MAERKKSLQKAKPAAGWRALRLGTRLLVFNEDEAIQLLRAAVEGNQVTFAKRHRIDRSYLNRILSGKKGFTSAVLNALGLRKVYARQNGAMKMRRRKQSEMPGYWIRRSQNLGIRRDSVFDDSDALVLLKAAIERAGSQAAFAAQHGIHRSYVSLVLARRYPVPRAILKALGLRRVYVEQTSPLGRGKSSGVKASSPDGC